jgi:hypothetical protein
MMGGDKGASDANGMMGGWGPGPAGAGMYGWATGSFVLIIILIIIWIIVGILLIASLYKKLTTKIP